MTTGNNNDNRNNKLHNGKHNDYDRDMVMDDMEHDDKQFVDALLRQQFGTEVPPETEERLREQLAAFRTRMNEREAHEHAARRGWGAWLFAGHRAVAALALGAAGIVVAGIIVNQNVIAPQRERGRIEAIKQESVTLGEPVLEGFPIAVGRDQAAQESTDDWRMTFARGKEASPAIATERVLADQLTDIDEMIADSRTETAGRETHFYQDTTEASTAPSAPEFGTHLYSESVPATAPPLAAPSAPGAAAASASAMAATPALESSDRLRSGIAKAGVELKSADTPLQRADSARGTIGYTYDPSNGTVADGDVWRVRQGPPAPADQPRQNDKVVARTKADTRSLATAIEAYYFENNEYAEAKPTKSPLPESASKQVSTFRLAKPAESAQAGESVRRLAASSHGQEPAPASNAPSGQAGAYRFSPARESAPDTLVGGSEGSGVVFTDQITATERYGVQYNVDINGEAPVQNWNFSTQEEGALQMLGMTESQVSREGYDRIHENPFVTVQAEPLSTFSIDVDTASYTNVRRMLSQNQIPPPDAIRIEEFINYFDYDYAPPQEGAHPFAVHTEAAAAPWTPANRLLKIGIKGYEVPNEERPDTNLVFLIDVSGSMRPSNKLPLLKQTLALLVNELTERDRVAIVVYAGASGLVLPSTKGDQKDAILDALEKLNAGGSTNGGAGIELAYNIAQENFVKDGANRVILCTDGDFNVGVTDRTQLTTLIETKAKSGVFLTILGFGMGNLKDATMEELSNKGNGNYAYIDSLDEGRKVLVEQIGGTLLTIAKDVKIQVEFNPMQVKEYRLIGYENRALAAEDFNDDTKDAGEIGAGHTVTALFEIVTGVAQPDGKVDALKYQKTTEPTQEAFSGEMGTVKIRYKQPDGDTSTLLEVPVRDTGAALDQASEDFRFAASVAAFGMILRRSQHCGAFTLSDVRALAQQGLGDDIHSYRKAFLTIIDQAAPLMPKPDATTSPTVNPEP